MKYSESWLREWVNPDLKREALAEALTMAGFEVEAISPVAAPFTHVCVGQVLTVEKHPEATRLHVCEVDVGSSPHLQIVCGAANASAGMKVAVARSGTKLPAMTIASTSIRGVLSQGMLCSAAELGFAEDSEGIISLPCDAPIGQDFREYLKLDDVILDISITPNRGDCLSIKGMAREMAAITQMPFKNLSIPNVKSSLDVSILVNVMAQKECPCYCIRVIHDINPDVTTPTWLKEKLRRSEIRSIHPVVDIVNMVMLELGQPMHAFDRDAIQKGVVVRLSKPGETLALLDGSNVILDAKTLVIADHEKPLAMAGVMGGLSSSVTSKTTHILLESAYFQPNIIARERQQYHLNSDSAYRFERGIDPTIQRQAIERATQLILEIMGGKAGAVIEKRSKKNLPAIKTITLSSEKIATILGVKVPDREIKSILHALQFSFQHKEKIWHIQVPPHRSDIALPEDIIEEVARLYGYDRIPTHRLHAPLQINPSQDPMSRVRQALCQASYHEIITYSFIDKTMQALLDPQETPHELLNPISADMSVMRTNLWPGLLNTLIYNISRQQHRIRLFETGTCFVRRHQAMTEEARIGGLITGLVVEEQWGIAPREADFYDVKGDIEKLFQQIHRRDLLNFKRGEHPALHPGQTALVLDGDVPVGILGALHPHVLQTLGLTKPVFVFELNLALFQKEAFLSLHEISKFPEIRRDLALLVDQTVPTKEIQDTIRRVAGDWLKDVFIFDLYQGKGVPEGLKSIALALILQHATRTLVDDEVAERMDRVVTALKEQFGAELRS